MNTKTFRSLIHIDFPTVAIMSSSVGAVLKPSLDASNYQRTNANLSKSSDKVCKMLEISKFFVLTIVYSVKVFKSCPISHIVFLNTMATLHFFHVDCVLIRHKITKNQLKSAILQVNVCYFGQESWHSPLSSDGNCGVSARNRFFLSNFVPW